MPAALVYADLRALHNALHALRSKPWRLVLWGLYAIAICGFAFLKTSPATRSVPQQQSAFALAIDDVWICGFAVAFGIVLATGTARWLGVFSSRAEALLLTRAEAPPLLVAAYLQLRAVVAALAQGFARFAYLIVIGIPTGNTLGGLAAELCFFAAAGAAVASVALPRALARGAVRAAMIAAGTAIAVAAALPVLLDALQAMHLPAGPLLQHLTVHPGLVLNALAAGDLRAVLVPLAVAACATAGFALAGRDAYPELYAISLANFDGHTRSAGNLRARVTRGTSRARPRGALTFLWVDALTFTRNVSPVLTAVVAGLALGGGALFAVFAQHNPELTFGILVGTLPGIAITVASTTGVRLAPVMRMPLFWLGDVPLAGRLAAWACGPFWRDAVLVALAAAGYVAVTGELRSPSIFFVGALGLLALTRAVGLAVFALLPNALDQRGPAVMLRAVLSFAFVAPAAVAGTIAALTVQPSLLAGVVAGTAVALGEAILLVAFAAWRLAGRVDRLAVA